MTKAAEISERILVLAPTGNDAANAVEVLHRAGLAASSCRDVPDLADQFFEGAGALLVAEEGLTSESAVRLVEVLSGQPRWSDIPLLLITGAGVTAEAGRKLLNFFAPHGNVTLVERPLRPISLVSAAQTALRARRRQYQLRDFLEEQEETLARIHESEERYRTLFNSIDEGFCVVEMLFDEKEAPVDYRFLEVNPVFEKHTGLQQAPGKTMRQLIPDQDPHWFEVYGQVALTGQSIRFENYSEAMQRWFDVYAFRAGQPQERKIALLFNDITDRKRVEAERERETRRLQLLADAAGQLLSSTSPEETVRAIFARVSPELGVDVYFNFMVGENGDTLVLDSSAGVPDDLVHQVWRLPFGTPVCGRVAQQRQPWTLSQVQISDDPRLPLLRQVGLSAYTCNPLIVGDRLLGTLSFGSRTREQFSPEDIDYMRTICHFVALAQERALHQRDLEKRVNERTARLQETIGELEAFSYSVSHDLRAPLRAMQGYSQFLLEDYAGRVDETGKDYINRIVKAAERLDRLVSDILTYSRVARAHIETRPIDLEKLIQDIIHSYPPLQPERADIQIQSPLPRVIGHEGSLTQCISNLLGNAVKFVPEDRKPRIRIWAERHDAKVVIQFQDNGIGIAPEHRERIFHMFEKAPQDREYEGTGIGLAIVRKAVERMGGDVGVESAPGKGSNFWIELPLAS